MSPGPHNRHRRHDRPCQEPGRKKIFGIRDTPPFAGNTQIESRTRRWVRQRTFITEDR